MLEVFDRLAKRASLREALKGTTQRIGREHVRRLFIHDISPEAMEKAGGANGLRIRFQQELGKEFHPKLFAVEVGPDYAHLRFGAGKATRLANELRKKKGDRVAQIAAGRIERLIASTKLPERKSAPWHAEPRAGFVSRAVSTRGSRDLEQSEQKER